MEIYNIYFSPTGGTKKAADIVCRALADGQNVTEIDLSVYGEDYSRYQLKKRGSLRSRCPFLWWTGSGDCCRTAGLYVRRRSKSSFNGSLRKPGI